MARYFGYEIQNFEQINNINELMPMEIGSIHNLLMYNICYRGYTILYGRARRVFFQNANSYIEPVRIMVSDLYLSFDDYIIMGSLSKDKSETSYIVFDLNGNIIGLTEEIFEMVFDESNMGVREV